MWLTLYDRRFWPHPGDPPPGRSRNLKKILAPPSVESERFPLRSDGSRAPPPRSIVARASSATPDVRLLGRVHLLAPRCLEHLVADDRRRHHEVRLRLVDIALGELRVREAGSVAYELMGERAAHSLEKERIVRVLENASVSLLLDILEVFPSRPARGILLTHVAEASRKLRESLAVSTLAEPVDWQMRRLGEGGSGENSDSRLGENHGARIFWNGRKQLGTGNRQSYPGSSMSDSRDVE